MDVILDLLVANKWVVVGIVGFLLLALIGALADKASNKRFNFSGEHMHTNITANAVGADTSTERGLDTTPAQEVIAKEESVNGSSDTLSLGALPPNGADTTSLADATVAPAKTEKEKTLADTAVPPAKTEEAKSQETLKTEEVKGKEQKENKETKKS